MNAIPFDTLKFARALRDKAKLPPEQAEGFADAIAEAVQGDLATRADLLGVAQVIRTELREVELRLEGKLDGKIESVRGQIESMRAETGERIEASKAEILKWMFGTVGFQTILILGAVIALARVVVKA